MLTDSERKSIEQAIARIEKRSSAEIVVAVVERSGRYPALRLVVAWATGLTAAFLYARLEPWHAVEMALGVQIVVAVLGYLVTGLPVLEPWLIGRSSAEREVMLAASVLFLERGLTRTRDHTGVLVYLSRLERRAVILGDEGIHARVGPEGWKAHVDLLVSRIRAGEAAAGILELLERIEATLVEHFPRKPDDTNELSDTVIER